MSQASSSPRSSAYLDALTQAIEKKLQRALASPSQRRNLLQELFADIALEIDERAKEMILSREEDAISPAEDGIEGQLCFYDVLTDHYVRVPESGKRILDLIVQLWSQSFASHIFALLFHKWLFEVQLDNSEVLLRYSSALVEGATNVFWSGQHTYLGNVGMSRLGWRRGLMEELSRPPFLRFSFERKILRSYEFYIAAQAFMLVLDINVQVSVCESADKNLGVYGVQISMRMGGGSRVSMALGRKGREMGGGGTCVCSCW